HPDPASELYRLHFQQPDPASELCRPHLLHLQPAQMEFRHHLGQPKPDPQLHLDHRLHLRLTPESRPDMTFTIPTQHALARRITTEADLLSG
ncbi:MAG: hypothetical protein AAGJ35_11355, partial [Myxococcota bacterium]